MRKSLRYLWRGFYNIISIWRWHLRPEDFYYTGELLGFIFIIVALVAATIVVVVQIGGL